MQTLNYHRNIDSGWTNYPGIVKELHIYGQSAAKLLSNVVKHEMKNVHRLSRKGVEKEISRNGRNFYFIRYICKQQFTNMAKRQQKEYRIWKNMKARCYSPCNFHQSYQKNNIQVCERWMHSYDNFLKDMGECPPNCSLDRIDNDGDYSPENCRWADSSTQTKNRGSFNLLYTYNNETKVLKDWARYFGISYNTLHSRIFRSGRTFEQAIDSEFDAGETMEYKGIKYTIEELSNTFNIRKQLIYDRRSRGWTTEKIVEHPTRKSPNKN
jgi:hypothetical protein